MNDLDRNDPAASSDPDKLAHPASEADNAVAATKMSVSDRIAAYLDGGGWQTIVGACDAATLVILRDLDALQREHGIVGDLAEIGVSGGRLLIMLGLLARPEESAVAIDVFEVESNYDSGGASATLQGIQDNYQRFVGDASEPRTIADDSLHLTAATFRAGSKSGQARLFSIDGAHSYFHTASDMVLASEIVVPGGIVMVDDITNPGWPGVMEGVARYFLNGSCPKLFPFMMAYNKLWLTTYDYHAVYLDYALNQAPLFAPEMVKRVTRFYGSDLVGF